MKCKTILLGFILITINSFSQKKVNSIVSGTENSNNGVYTYKADIEFRFETTGPLTDIKVYRKINSYKINSYQYKNTSATEVGIQFPIIKTKASLVDAIVDIEFYKGQLSYTAHNLNCNGSAYLSNSQIGNLLRIFNIDPNKKDCITCDPIKEVNKLNIKAKNIRLTNLGYTDEFSAINTKIETLLKDQKQSTTKKTEVAESTDSSKVKTPNQSENSTTQAKKTLPNSKQPVNNSNNNQLGSEPKESPQDKALKEANEQLARSRRQYEQLQQASIKLSRELDTQLENAFVSYEKQREFTSRINSLTKIKSTSINEIIAEANRKSEAINVAYAGKKIDKRNEISKEGQRYANKAKTQSELELSNSITQLNHTLSQYSLEKQRREAQKELRQDQKNAEKEVEDRFIERILPSLEQHVKLAFTAVFENDEKYYLEKFNYDACLIENSYAILSGHNSCQEPKLKKPKKNPKPSANDYYKAYVRKKSSSFEQMNKVAYIQLELAIDANPNNAQWLYEYTLIKDLNAYEKAAILRRAHDIDSNNTKINEAFELAMKEAEKLKIEEIAYIQQQIDKKFDYDWEQHSNLLGFFINDKHIFVNQSGDEILKFEKKHEKSFFTLKGINKYLYGEETQFNQDLARLEMIQNKERLFGYINSKGDTVIPGKYSDAKQFSEGLAAVKDKDTNLWGYIDLEGNLIIPYQFSEASVFSEGLAAIAHPSYPYGAYLNKNGQVAIEGKKKYRISEPFINGVSMVQTGTAGSYTWQSHEDHYKYILPSGEFLFRKRFVKTFPFNKKGYAIVGSAQSYDIIDKSGKKQNTKSFKDYPQFTKGKAKVDIGTWFTYKYIYIDTTGKTIEE